MKTLWMVELGKARGNRMRTFSERALASAGCGISRAKVGMHFSGTSFSDSMAFYLPPNNRKGPGVLGI
jgi:hypothetical protein